jgi:phenylalanyl-tRNA synthetase beta subunit
LKDRKLHKFVEQNQAIKAITDHIQKLGISTASANTEEKSNGKSESELKASKIEIAKYDENFKIDYDMSVKDVRGYILCCIVNNLELNATSLKEFLQFQTKLHDTLCKKREIATIATHDLGLTPLKHLRYAAKHKDDIQIHPLRAAKIISGSAYFTNLEKEAEAIRKEKKRNNVTGVYKFLDLLKGKNEFAFLEAADTKVCLSLPPLTNSDATKLSTNTKQMLIEVTSNFNAAICNQVMLEMIKKLHQIMNGALELQQVRITNAVDGSVKTLYPSKVDLKELESEIQVIRP